MKFRRVRGLKSSRLAFYGVLTLALLLLAGGVSAYYFTQSVASTTPTASKATPNSKVEEAEAGENDADAVKVDGPQELIDWEFSRQRNAKNVVPANGIKNGVAQAKRLPRATGTALPNTAGATPGSWQWIGPGNVGGRIRALAVNPTNTNVIYLGGIAGGVWKSSDGAQTWQLLTDFLPNMAVSTLVFDPSDTTYNTIYAGTGEGYYNADGIQGNGIFKSTDGGATWGQLTSTNNSNFYYVTRLSFSNNGNTMLAATRAGIFRSTDKGATWTLVLPSPNPSTRNIYYQAVFNPADPTKAVAGGSAGLAAYSTDGGATWTPATTTWQTSNSAGFAGYNRVELAYAPSSPNIVYASTTNISGGFTSQLWKSTDGGQTYTQLSATGGSNALYQQGWYANTLAVSPIDPNFILWSGLDIYRSTDGGANFTQISDWTNAPPNSNLSAHADHHGTFFDPGFNGTTDKRVYFTNDGGIFKAEDVTTVAATSGWTNLNHNLGITQFYGGAGNAINGNIVAGAQDNGTQVYSGDAQNWQPMYGGDGGFAAADPTDPNFYYGEYVYLRIHRSTNGGLSASTIISGLTEANSSSNANFIAPFILDPNNPNTMYGGGTHLWRTTNVKATTPIWSQVANLPVPGSTCASARACISAIAVAKGNPDVIWVGRSNGTIYYTTNGTAASPTWTQVDANLPGGTPGRAVNRITIDPQNSSVVYVSLGGYTSGNLLKTTNNGAAGSWTDATGTGVNKLPQVPIYSMAVHPYTSNWLYVGTVIGLFASEDGGQNWQVAPGDGPTSAPVNELSWLGDSTTLLAVTHGRGIFKADIPSNIPILNATTSTVTEGTGNGNGVFDPGETVKVKITLKNTGSVTASAISSTLTVASGPATIVQGSSSYSDILSNTTGVNTNDYIVGINSNANCGDHVTLHQTVTYVGGRITTYDISFVIGSATLGPNQHYVYSGSNVAVPDNDPNGIDVPVTVTTSGKAGKIKVTFSATMTYDGDLTFSLISPNGKATTLIAQRGAGGKNFVNTVLDDAATTAIADGSAPFTGSFKPEQPLATLTDESLSGVWKLHIVDGGPGDFATITDFQLDIQPNYYTCACSSQLNVTNAADGTSCGTLRYALEQAIIGNGPRTITISTTLGSAIVVTSPLPAVPAGVAIQGGCANGVPKVVIDGTGVNGPGLTLSGNNTLSGLKIKGFNGPQLKVGPPTGGASHFSCVVASKS